MTGHAPRDSNLIPRHELWRKEYRANPYFNKLNEKEFIKAGAEIFSSLGPYLLKGCTEKRFGDKGSKELLISWTHFLEEAGIRKLDSRKLNFDLLELK